jgi:ketosteroid isomerase-like protein
MGHGLSVPIIKGGLMAEHPNAERIRRAFAAFAQGDMATMTELIAEDTVWHIPGRGPLSGDHRGRDTVFELFSRLVQGSEGTFTQELHDALGSDEHAVALTHASARRGPHTYDFNDAWVFHLRNGQIAEAWWRPEDLYASDEFWT